MTIHSTSQVYWLSSRSAACDPGSQCAGRRVEDFNTDTVLRFASLKGKDRSAWCLIARRRLFSQLHREQPNHSELLHLLCNRSNSNLNAEAHYSLQHMFKCHVSFPVSHYVRLRGLQGSRLDRFYKQGQSLPFLLSWTNRNEDLWSDAVSSTVVNISSSLFRVTLRAEQEPSAAWISKLKFRFANARLDYPDDVDLVRSSTLSVEPMNFLHHVNTVNTSYCSWQ